jgi:hypothetical protein
VEPIFAVPSLEGATMALRSLLVEGHPVVTATSCCAVAIDVFSERDVLIQRAIAHAEVEKDVRFALSELLDRHVSRFAEAQRIDAAAANRSADPYRGGMVQSNDFHGFPVGYASSIARDRVAKLRSSLRSADLLEVHLYAVPFLVVEVDRGYRSAKQSSVVLRAPNGAYVYETCAPRT